MSRRWAPARWRRVRSRVPLPMPCTTLSGCACATCRSRPNGWRPPPPIRSGNGRSEFALEPIQHALPRVGGIGCGVVLRSVAHEPVAGVGIDDGVSVMGGDLLDVLSGDPRVLATEEQQGGAVGRTELACDRAAVEADGRVKRLRLDRHAVGETTAHAEAGDADLRRAEVAENPR